MLIDFNACLHGFVIVLSTLVYLQEPFKTWLKTSGNSPANLPHMFPTCPGITLPNLPKTFEACPRNLRKTSKTCTYKLYGQVIVGLKEGRRSNFRTRESYSCLVTTRHHKVGLRRYQDRNWPTTLLELLKPISTLKSFDTTYCFRIRTAGMNNTKCVFSFFCMGQYIRTESESKLALCSRTSSEPQREAKATHTHTHTCCVVFFFFLTKCVCVCSLLCFFVGGDPSIGPPHTGGWRILCDSSGI